MQTYSKKKQNNIRIWILVWFWKVLPYIKPVDGFKTLPVSLAHAEEQQHIVAGTARTYCAFSCRNIKECVRLYTAPSMQYTVCYQNYRADSSSRL